MIAPILTDEIDLFAWQSPEQMLLNAETVRSTLGILAIHRQGQDFREAYVASRFAQMRQADAVRLLQPLSDQPTPDFAVKISSCELWFETTEADRPGRKRGDEDHRPICVPRPIPDKHWVLPDDYQIQVSERALSKASKRYDRCDGLIVWSNAWPIDNQQTLTPQWRQDACRPAKHAFSEVWVGKNVDLKDVFMRIF